LRHTVTLITFGQQSVDSALTAILNSSTPLFVCVISALWTRHERITPGRLFGVIAGLGGVAVLAGASALLELGRETTGQAAILIATFSSAASVIYGRRFANISPEVVAAGMLTCAAGMLVPLCLVLEAPWHIAPSVASMAALSVNAVVVTAFGFVIYFRLIQTIGSMGTASSSFLKPGIGVLIGCLLMGEPFTRLLAIGLLAILFGVAAINEETSILFLANTIKYVESRLWRRNRPIVIGKNGT
jgi:drug/metabolite transporter (DMT)-like permease